MRLLISNLPAGAPTDQPSYWDPFGCPPANFSFPFSTTVELASVDSSPSHHKVGFDDTTLRHHSQKQNNVTNINNMTQCVRSSRTTSERSSLGFT